MKKVLIGVGICLVAFIALKACCTKGVDPVDVAKDHVVAQFEGINCDISKLKFDEVEVNEETAVIKVSGKVVYDDEISLIKQDDEWIIGTLPEEEVQEVQEVQEAPEADKDEHAADTAKAEPEEHGKAKH